MSHFRFDTIVFHPCLVLLLANVEVIPELVCLFEKVFVLPALLFVATRKNELVAVALGGLVLKFLLKPLAPQLLSLGRGELEGLTCANSLLNPLLFLSNLLLASPVTEVKQLEGIEDHTLFDLVIKGRIGCK